MQENQTKGLKQNPQTSKLTSFKEMCAEGVALYGEAMNWFRTDADSTTLNAGLVYSCENIFAPWSTSCSTNNPNNTIVGVLNNV